MGFHTELPITLTPKYISISLLNWPKLAKERIKMSTSLSSRGWSGAVWPNLNQQKGFQVRARSWFTRRGPYARSPNWTNCNPTDGQDIHTSGMSHVTWLSLVKLLRNRYNFSKLPLNLPNYEASSWSWLFPEINNELSPGCQPRPLRSFCKHPNVVRKRRRKARSRACQVVLSPGSLWTGLTAVNRCEAAAKKLSWNGEERAGWSPEESVTRHTHRGETRPRRRWLMFNRRVSSYRIKARCK